MNASARREWAQVVDHLKAEVGDAAYHSWLQPMTLERADDGEVIIAAPTRFLRDWVATHYADRLLALWRSENKRVTSVSIVVAVS
jgi:chromosomal replication initiator protein